MLQFYSYRLALRNHSSTIHNAGKLFQLYVVDLYLKCEGTRLNYIKANQDKLRVDLYNGLMDHVHHRAQDHGAHTGHICILPSSFQGSPRAMQQNYQDAMAIVGKYGKPDLFITFTCNPKWREVQDNLHFQEKPENWPGLIHCQSIPPKTEGASERRYQTKRAWSSSGSPTRHRVSKTRITTFTYSTLSPQQ